MSRAWLLKKEFDLKALVEDESGIEFLSGFIFETFELSRGLFTNEELLNLLRGERLAGKLFPDGEFAAFLPAAAAEGFGCFSDDAFLTDRTGADANGCCFGNGWSTVLDSMSKSLES